MRLFAAIRGRGAAATALANNSSAAATIRADTSITKLLVLFWARQTRQHPPQDGIAIDELVFERSQHMHADQAKQQPGQCHMHRRQRGTERGILRSEEHTSELQSLMRISYSVFCLTKTTHTHYI